MRSFYHWVKPFCKNFLELQFAPPPTASRNGLARPLPGGAPATPEKSVKKSLQTADHTLKIIRSRATKSKNKTIRTEMRKGFP